MPPDNNRKWWVVSAAVCLFALGIVLAIAAFVHYVRDESDLLVVDARAQRLGIPQLAAAQEISSAREQFDLSSADREVQRLKNSETCEMLTMTQMIAFATSRSAYHENLPKLQNLVDVWGDTSCERCESDIDALPDHPIITDTQLFGRSIERQAILRFLALRLFTAQRPQVSERELRLARYLLTLDPRSASQLPWHGLPYLTCRIDEVDSRRDDLSRIVQRLADDLPDRMRRYLAMDFVNRMSFAKIGGRMGMDGLGDYPGWLDDSLPVASWEVRHWRAPVLQHWIDTYATLDCAGSSALAAKPGPTGPASPFTLGRSANDLRTYQLFSQRMCVHLVMLQSIKARLDGQPMPHDPFATAGQSLRSRTMGDHVVYYSIGRDGIDNGGLLGDLPILTVWTPPMTLP